MGQNFIISRAGDLHTLFARRGGKGNTRLTKRAHPMGGGGAEKGEKDRWRASASVGGENLDTLQAWGKKGSYRFAVKKRGFILAWKKQALLGQYKLVEGGKEVGLSQGENDQQHLNSS